MLVKPAAGKGCQSRWSLSSQQNGLLNDKGGATPIKVHDIKTLYFVISHHICNSS